MRLSGLSLLGLLTVLVIIAMLAAHDLSHSLPVTASPGTVGGYGNAISAAQTSAAQQDAATDTPTVP